jgi:hypothetical protein
VAGLASLLMRSVPIGEAAIVPVAQPESLLFRAETNVPKSLFYYTLQY